MPRNPLEFNEEAIKNLRNLKEEMYKAGYRSFAKFGQAVNISSSYLWRIAKGDTIPTTEIYNAISKSLGWNVIPDNN